MNKNRFVKQGQAYINPSKVKQLCEKWAPVLNFESASVAPITNDRTRINTAMLLENQERYCLTEGNVAGNSGVFGTGVSQFTPWNANGTPGGNTDAYAHGDARLPKILIPMIRRTFPELISNEIVGVQPMGGPVGLAFALRYKYSTESLGYGIDGPTEAWNKDRFDKDNGKGGWGISAEAKTQLGETKPYANEIGYQKLDTRFTGASAGYLSGMADTAAITDADLTAAGGEASDRWNFAEEDAGVAALLNNYEITGNIPQVEISFEKTAVTAGTRRLGARWSVELEQDLKNMNGIEIDTELTGAMSYEIQAEIDREMITRILQVALNAKQFCFWNAASADARWSMERSRDFYQHLILEANKIGLRNRRGSANFIVCTPTVAAMIEAMPEFVGGPVNGNVDTQPVGIAKVGSLARRFNVYRDTRTPVQTGEYGYHPSDRTPVEYALLGFKGSEYYDTGLIYCPYIPIMVQRTIGSNDFAPRVGMLTRYGVVDNIFGANLYYSVIICKNLNKGFTPGVQVKYF